MKNKVRIGARSSMLSLWQAEFISKQIKKIHKISTEIIPIRSQGDKITHLPFEKMNGKGFFTKELDEALLNDKIDIAVHSLKDVPTEYAAELTILAVTKRGDPRDALITPKKNTLEKLPFMSILATGSTRRRSQLLAFREDLKIVSLRGNIQTRFRKFYDSNWDGMILAVAGIDRLGLEHKVSERISVDIMLPAVGQGALAVMGKKGSQDLQDICLPLQDKDSAIVSSAERSFLKELGGGCTSPIGCYGKIEKHILTLKAFVGEQGGSHDRTEPAKKQISGDPRDARALGSSLARSMFTNESKR